MPNTADCHGIISYALSFYEDLYKAELCDEEMVDLLLQDLPQFSEGEKSILDKLLTFDELSVAVQEDAAHWWWLRRDPLYDCKALWVYSNTQ